MMQNRIIIPLRNPEQWRWKTNKHGVMKIHIRGKMKKWLKRTCTGNYVIIRGEVPPVLWITDETDALMFKLIWG